MEYSVKIHEFGCANRWARIPCSSIVPQTTAKTIKNRTVLFVAAHFTQSASFFHRKFRSQRFFLITMAAAIVSSDSTILVCSVLTHTRTLSNRDFVLNKNELQRNAERSRVCECARTATQQQKR